MMVLYHGDKNPMGSNRIRKTSPLNKNKPTKSPKFAQVSDESHVY